MGANHKYSSNENIILQNNDIFNYDYLGLIYGIATIDIVLFRVAFIIFASSQG